MVGRSLATLRKENLTMMEHNQIFNNAVKPYAEDDARGARAC
jgi:hypothetical protein